MTTAIYDKELHFTKAQIINHLKNALTELEECVDIAEVFIAGIQIDLDFEENTITIID